MAEEVKISVSADTTAAINAMKQLSETLSKFSGEFSKISESITRQTKSLNNTISTMSNNMILGFNTVSKGMKNIDDDINRGMKSIVAALNKQLKVQLDISDALAGMKKVTTGADEASDKIKDTFNGSFFDDFISTIRTAFTSVYNIVSSIVSSIGTSFKDMFMTFLNFMNPITLVTSAISTLVSGFTTLFDIVSTFGKALYNVITLPFTILSGAISGVFNVITSLGNGLSTVLFNLGNLGNTLNCLLIIFTPLVEIFKSFLSEISNSIGLVSDFEMQISKVAAVAGEAGTGLDAFRAKALQIGQDTALSATQAADALYFLVSAGYETSEALQAAADAANLAMATQYGMSESGELMVNVTTQFGLEATKAGMVADVLTKACNATALTMGRLGYSLKYVGPIAGALKIPLTEVVAVLGALSNAGIRGEQGGTTLRSVMTDLSKDTERVTKVLAKYGITFKDVDLNTHTLSETLGKLSSAGMKTADIMEAFGEVAGPGMISLMNQGTGAIASIQGQLEQAGGYAKAAAEQMYDNLGGAIEKFKGSFENIKIDFGEIFQKPLQHIVNFAESITNEAHRIFMAGGAFKQFSETLDIAVNFIVATLRQFATIFGDVSAVVFSYIIKINNLFREFVDTFSNAGNNFNTFITRIVAFTEKINLSAVAGSIFDVVLSSLNDIITELCISFNTILTAVTDVLDGFSEFESLSTIQSIFKAVANSILNFKDSIINAIRYFTDMTVLFIKSGEATKLFNNVFNIAGHIVSVFSSIITAVPGILATVIPIILTITERITGFADALMQGNFSGAFEVLVNAVNGVFQEIVNIVERNKQTIKMAMSKTIRVFNELGPEIYTACMTFFDNFTLATRQFIPKFSKMGLELILNFIRTISYTIIEYAPILGDTIRNMFGSSIGKAVTDINTTAPVSYLTNNMRSAFETAFKAMQVLVYELSSAVVDSIIKAFKILNTDDEGNVIIVGLTKALIDIEKAFKNKDYTGVILGMFDAFGRVYDYIAKIFQPEIELIYNYVYLKIMSVVDKITAAILIWATARAAIRQVFIAYALEISVARDLLTIELEIMGTTLQAALTTTFLGMATATVTLGVVFGKIGKMFKDWGMELTGICLAVGGACYSAFMIGLGPWGVALAGVLAICTMYFKEIFGEWEYNWEAIKTVTLTTWENLQTSISDGWEIWKGLFNSGCAYIGETFSNLGPKLASIGNSIYNSITTVFKNIGSSISTIFSKACDFVTDKFSYITKMFDKIKEMYAYITGASTQTAQKSQTMEEMRANLKPGEWIGTDGYIHSMRMADGGIVKATSGGVQTTIGEAGEDEAVIPLKHGKVPVNITNESSSSGSNIINLSFGDIHVYNEADEDRLIEKMKRALYEMNLRTNGRR